MERCLRCFLPLQEPRAWRLPLHGADGAVMLETPPVTTCLSSNVHNMVCKLGFELQDRYDIRRILTQDNQVCWETLSEILCYEGSGQCLDYRRSVRHLGPVCEAIHSHLTNFSCAEFEEQFGWCFHWTNNAKLFLNALSLLKSLDVVKISLSLMKMTSCLERSLGDVYLMIGTDCPFLLRDLLASAELAKILSKPAMDVMKIFLGSPESLNLRNILWHGFASPYEIPPKYCTTLLLLTAGLGQLVRNYLSQTQSSLEHRPYFVFYNPEAMQVFPDINDDVLSFAETFIEKSTFVLVHMVPFWTEAFTAFREGRYADCAVLLLPQLETGLRLIFASVNKCPNRILTAESAVLYTTFDEILAKQLDNESDNKVLHTLGEPAMEFLWDMLNHQEGPRVRDHLSHGEIQLDDFPREIANQILGFSVMLLCKQLHQDDTFSQAISIFKPLFDAAECYRSVFHPIALLQKQVLECSESLQKWSLLPSPSQDHSHKVTGSDDITYPGIILHQDTTYILSQLERQVTDYIDIDNLDTWLLTDKWFSTMNMLCRKYITNLYCHRWVLEAVGVLRKVIKHCYIVSSNIISTSELRYEQWLCKALHSRQRQNYLRMLSSIKVLTPIFRLIVLLVTVELHNIHSVSEKTAADYQKYIKYIKAILQYTENLSTCTSLDKNRWDEAIELSRGILLKIRRFYENMNQYSH